MVDRWKRANPELMLLGPQRKDKRRIALVWPRMSSSKPGPGAWPQDKIEALWQAVLKEGMKQRGVFERIAAAVSKVGPWRAAAVRVSHMGAAGRVVLRRPADRTARQRGRRRWRRTLDSQVAGAEGSCGRRRRRQWRGPARLGAPHQGDGIWHSLI